MLLLQISHLMAIHENSTLVSRVQTYDFAYSYTYNVNQSKERKYFSSKMIYCNIYNLREILSKFSFSYMKRTVKK